MRLFKFKSLENFEFISDIICYERFYASNFFDLNDPMEGQFDHDPNTKREYIDEIIRGKQKLRICSFSQNLGNILLWAHYADSFKGICFEVEVKANSETEIVKVNYSPFTVYVSDQLKSEIKDLPSTILSGKNEAWKYENEVRLLSRSEHINTGIKINAIYLGLRTPTVLKDTIARLVSPNISVFETTFERFSNQIEKSGRYKIGRA